MEFVQHVSKTDLMRNFRRVISTIQRGRMAVVESRGEPKVAILDIADFRVLRAVMRYYARERVIDIAEGLSDAAAAAPRGSRGVDAQDDVQESFDCIIAHYLAGAISLSRAAELLNVSWLDLRDRFLRLEVPIRSAPADLAEALSDVETATALSSSDQS